MKSDTILIVGGLAIGAYAVYKILDSTTPAIKEASSGVGSAIGQTGVAVGDVTTRYGEALGSYADVFNSGFDKINSLIKKIGTGQSITSTPVYTTTKFDKKGDVESVTTSSTPSKISKSANEIANANATAYYSNMTYDADKGVLIDKATNKGYSVAPSEVSKVVKGIKTGINTINTTTGKQSTLKPSLKIVKK